MLRRNIWEPIKMPKRVSLTSNRAGSDAWAVSNSILECLAAQFGRSVLPSRRFFVLCVVTLLGTGIANRANAQQNAGPFVLHAGKVITTTFANEFGRDADARTEIISLTPETVSLQYSSTRGLFTRRDVSIRDWQSARVYVLGHSARMPTVIPGSTSLGISSAVLQELRTNGRAALTLIHSENLDRIECNLVATAVDVRVPLIIEDRIFDVPTVRAGVSCGAGNRTGTGQFVFANDVNNPILIESTLNFSWEQRPRTVRVTRIVAGLGLQAEMRQALDTLGTYDVYGLLFDFDSAQLRPETAQLVREIAVMLQQNPNWTILIAGHTDSTGGADHNMRLSEQRAASVKQALISSGVAAGRLQSVGHGMTKPKADNSTLAGRAINRRVEFQRLDR
jgi:outer membrane protein OmpA-like peptidoglycan-associated protein